MKVLFDTNVVLDLLLDRVPHAQTAAVLFSHVESGRSSGCVVATTITTVHYFVEKYRAKQTARTAIRDIISIVDVAQVDRLVIDKAIVSSVTDFEDAVLDEAACRCGANAIITRNLRDFKRARVPAYEPEMFLAGLQTER